MRQTLHVIGFLILSAAAISAQEPFKYKGVELTTPKMFTQTAERVRLERVKSNAAIKGEKKSDPDVLMLLQKCVGLFPDDFMCSNKFVEEYDRRGKERGFGVTPENLAARKYLIPAMGVLIKQAPQNHYRYFTRGLYYFENRQYKLALEDFSNSIKLNKTPDAGDYNFRARTYTALGKKDLAIADYKRSLSIRKGDAEAIKGLTGIYLEQNRGEEALSLLTTMIEADDEVKTGWIEERARVYTAMKKYDLAMKDIDELEKIWGDSAQVPYNRGLVYQAQGEKEKAIVEFRKACEKMPYEPVYKQALEKLGVKL